MWSLSPHPWLTGGLCPFTPYRQFPSCPWELPTASSSCRSWASCAETPVNPHVLYGIFRSFFCSLRRFSSTTHPLGHKIGLVITHVSSPGIWTEPVLWPIKCGWSDILGCPSLDIKKACKFPFLHFGALSCHTRGVGCTLDREATLRRIETPCSQLHPTIWLQLRKKVYSSYPTAA